MPNLMQTLEGTPAFVHAGPFANIAHGNTSIVADQIALKLADYVVTESGFGADIGMEKFMDIKCRYSGLDPELRRDRGDGARAQDARRRAQGRGRPAARQGLHRREPGAARKGRRATWSSTSRTPSCSACRSSWRSTRSSTTPRRRSSSCKRIAEEAGAEGAFKCTHWMHGGKGAIELAEAVMDASQEDEPL